MIGKHVPEDMLELYALKRLQAEEVDRIDDHLFVCEHCRQRLVESERYIAGFRLAIRKLETSTEKPRSAPWALLWGWSPSRGWAALAVCASLACVLFISQQRGQPVQYLDIALKATRGTGASFPAATAGVRYRLHLDTTGIDLGKPAVVTVANDAGIEIAREPGKKTGEREVIAVLNRELKPGTYFVRIASQTDPARTLREYALEVE